MTPEALRILEKSLWRQALEEVPVRFIFYRIVVLFPMLLLVLMGSFIHPAIDSYPVVYAVIYGLEISDWSPLYAFIIWSIFVLSIGMWLLSKVDHAAQAWANKRFRRLVAQVVLTEAGETDK